EARLPPAFAVPGAPSVEANSRLVPDRASRTATGRVLAGVFLARIQHRTQEGHRLFPRLPRGVGVVEGRKRIVERVVGTFIEAEPRAVGFHMRSDLLDLVHRDELVRSAEVVEAGNSYVAVQQGRQRRTVVAHQRIDRRGAVRLRIRRGSGSETAPVAEADAGEAIRGGEGRQIRLQAPCGREEVAGGLLPGCG